MQSQIISMSHLRNRLQIAKSTIASWNNRFWAQTVRNKLRAWNMGYSHPFQGPILPRCHWHLRIQWTHEHNMKKGNCGEISWIWYDYNQKNIVHQWIICFSLNFVLLWVFLVCVCVCVKNGVDQYLKEEAKQII
jgi:hypothetical protein